MADNNARAAGWLPGRDGEARPSVGTPENHDIGKVEHRMFDRISGQSGLSAPTIQRMEAREGVVRATRIRQ